MRSLKYTDYECGAKISFCSKCYGSSGENIKVARQEILKVNLERRLNYAESDAENEWVGVSEHPNFLFFFFSK